ncbi:hypothetical protein [Mesorhizobium sp. M0139]|uniref:hypothetical protein n=1 Tax=Mesorhizobium sp. M0139 TaxID=2956892 RepID=UPI003334CDF3
MKAVAAGLIIVIVLSVGALVATSSGVLLYQEKSADGYLCGYFTGIGTLTTPSYAVTGCPWIVSVDR